MLGAQRHIRGRAKRVPGVRRPGAIPPQFSMGGMHAQARSRGRSRSAALTVALPAAAQETIRLTVAAGHPPIFLWVKHLKETFMATVDAELAKTSKYKIAWTEAYGGTLAKIGSELETMQQGISDLGIVATVFQSSKLPLNNVTYFVPYGPADADRR